MSVFVCVLQKMLDLRGGCLSLPILVVPVSERLETNAYLEKCREPTS